MGKRYRKMTKKANGKIREIKGIWDKGVQHKQTLCKGDSRADEGIYGEGPITS